MPDPEGEAALIASEIERAMGERKIQSYGAFAVLYRTHAVGDAIEAALLHGGIPLWRVQRQRFLADPDAQESLRYLELAAGLHGQAHEPALNWPRTIIDEVSLISLRRMGQARGIGLFDVARQIDSFRDEVTPLTREAIKEFQATLGEELRPLVSLPMPRVLGPFLQALKGRRSPIAAAERPLLRDTLDHLETTLRQEASVLMAAVVAGRPVVVEHAGTADCLAALVIVEHALRRYFGSAVQVISGSGSVYDRPDDAFTISLGLDLTPTDDNIGIGTRSTRTVDLTVATRAWRLMQLVLMARETLDQGAFLLLDVETTNLDLTKAEMVEFAAVPFVEGAAQVGKGLESLVCPTGPQSISMQATDVHGLRWTDVRDAPSVQAILPDLLDRMRGAIVVGHNISHFDLPVLRRAAERAGMPFVPPDVIDTRAMAERLWPGEASYRLEDLVRRLEPDVVQRHRARDDCLLTGKLFAQLLAASRRDREIDVLSECIPVVAASILANGSALVNDNLLLLTIARRFPRRSWCECLLSAWRALVGRATADRVEIAFVSSHDSASVEESRWERLERGWKSAVEAFCAGESDPSVGRFLHFAALAQPIDIPVENVAERHADPRFLGPQERVALMTVHSAKGLEWDVVFLVGVEDDLFPHYQAKTPDEVDEERRVLYVGVTRARNRLYLLSVENRNGFRKACSRFLAPLIGTAVEVVHIHGG